MSRKSRNRKRRQRQAAARKQAPAPAATAGPAVEEPMELVPFEIFVKFEQVEPEQRIAFGFAALSDDEGGSYVDLQGDHIPETTLIRDFAEFMKNSRRALAMHDGEETGDIVFAMPITRDTAKAFGLGEPAQQGMAIGMHIPDDATWDRVKAGEFTGFSIGGQIIESETVEVTTD